MAQSTTRKSDTTAVVPAAAPPLPVPVELAADILADAGTTNDFRREDVAIPFLRILQPLSPECNKRDAKYVDGAEAGMFLNTLTGDVYDGEAGIVFVPVYYTPSYVEWVPRKQGGGFVKDHGTNAAVLDACVRDAENRDLLPNGNEIVFSMLYYGLLVHPETGHYQNVLLPLSSTQLKKAKKWNGLMASLQLPHPTQPGALFRPAMFYMAYRLTTREESNLKGSWYGVHVEPAQPTHQLPNGPTLYRSAREWRELVAGGRVTVDLTGMHDRTLGADADAEPASVAGKPARELPF
jgi:hypothetical protein